MAPATEMMNSKAIIKRLERDGWQPVGGRGDHQKFKHPRIPGQVIVPHPRKDMPIGTLRSIFRQAGWPEPPEGNE